MTSWSIKHMGARQTSCLTHEKWEATLTTIRPLADVFLGSSSNPGVFRVTPGPNFIFGDRQAHLVNCVHQSVEAAPRQRNGGATVNQGKHLRANVQRQAERRCHVEEPFAWTPLPQLGSDGGVAGGDSKVSWESRFHTFTCGGMLDGESIFIWGWERGGK